MSQQRRIDLLFQTTVAVMRMGHAIRSSGPVLAMLLVAIVAIHGTLGGEGPLQTAMASHRSFIDPQRVSRHDQVANVEAVGAPRELSDRVSADGAPQSFAESVIADPPVASAGGVRLDREQSNIARFIAGRYRTTLETTNQFVFHAYQAARDAKIDPMLVLAVMSVESSFDPRAQSPAGAQGLMQVLTKVHAEKFLPFGGIPAAFDPVANIRVGSDILKEYLKREGTVEGALKSYVGASFLQDDGGYGLKVLNARERIAAAAAGKPLPPEVAVRAARTEAGEPSSAGAVSKRDPVTADAPVAQRPETELRESSVPVPAAESALAGQNRAMGASAAPMGSGDI